MNVTTIGIDLAKSVFQLHGVDVEGGVVFRKERLGRLLKMGDGYLRWLLVVGATSVIRRVGTNTSVTGDWVRRLLERNPARVATVAMANKTARIAWAVLARGEMYRAPAMALAQRHCDGEHAVAQEL
ncbi:MAG: transposase [Maricaulis maris]|jgi:transposase